MCGRFAQQSSLDEVARALKAVKITKDEKRARYNIAPTQEVAAVRNETSRIETSGREMLSLRWGLVPAWAKDATIGARLIDARSETVTEKPSFKEAFKRRRCLIPADGFYEWKREGTHKQPYYFRMKEDVGFMFAGLWERWEQSGKTLETCTILTTTANEVLAPVHDRMPVILDPEVYDLWLEPEMTDTKLLSSLLHPYPAEQMTSYPVGLAVNKPIYDSADLIAPLVNSA